MGVDEVSETFEPLNFSLRRDVLAASRAEMVGGGVVAAFEFDVVVLVLKMPSFAPEVCGQLFFLLGRSRSLHGI